MPGSVTQVAAGLKARLATISGLRTFSYQPEQINPPVGYPVLNSVTYHRAFGGGDVVMDWSVYVVVGRWTDSRAFAILDGFLSYDGPSSLRVALEGDQNLNGSARALVVNSSISIEPQSQADAEFMTVRVDVTVHA
jgi:hypothetical protein